LILRRLLAELRTHLFKFVESSDKVRRLLLLPTLFSFVVFFVFFFDFTGLPVFIFLALIFDVLILVFMLPTSRAVAAAAVCSAAACVVRCRCASPLCDLSGSPACKCFSAAAAAAASGLRPGPSDPLRRRCWPALPHARAPA